MSTAASSSPVFLFHPPLPPSPPHDSNHSYLTTLGFGYSIAIALGFLVLLSTVLLSSYICCRDSRRRTTAVESTVGPGASVILPRVIFVAEEDLEAGDVNVGLDQAVINSYPKFHFSKGTSAASSDGFGSGGDTTCSICLCEYREAEMLRMMPECKHYFHLCCLDAWLKLNGSCPVCRNSPLPTPTSTPQSTPLSEVVPLSQYAADRRRARR
ncbi:RING-H2 finger protein ATL67 [Hirschfeldia incana]|nr:RING-H2 finger protein ATL67 [Hirschfeldia incana]